MTDKTAFAHISPGSSARICDRLGRTVAHSRNLRGVMRYASKQPCEVVELRALEGAQAGYFGVVFHYIDGANSRHVWSDWRVFLDWIAARRTWCGRIRVDSTLYDHPDFAERAKKVRSNHWYIQTR